MTNQADVITVKRKLNEMIKDCKYCKKCQVDMKIALVLKLPEIVLDNLHNFIECTGCDEIKNIIAKEVEHYHDRAFFSAIHNKAKRQWVTENVNEDFNETRALNILGYYSTQLYSLGFNNPWHDMFFWTMLSNGNVSPEVLRGFHENILKFEKSLVGKKICQCGSVVLAEGLKKHMETKKHRDWVYAVINSWSIELNIVLDN